MPSPTLNIGFNRGPATLIASTGKLAYRSPSAVLTLPASPAPSAQPIPGFGAYLISGNAYRYDNSTYQAYAALLYAHVMAWYPGWDGGSTQPMHTIMANINSLSTIGTKNFLYEDLWYVGGFPAEYPAAMTAHNWYLRTSFPSGSIVANPSGGNQSNMVTGGPTDSGGRTYQDYNVQYCLDYMMNAGAAGLATTGPNVLNPLVAGIFLDDAQSGATPPGDWLRTGSTQSGSAVDSAFRSGFVQISSKFKALKPALLVGANLTSASGFPGQSPVTNEYTAAFDHGVLEHMIGANSWEVNVGGFIAALQHYQVCMSFLKVGGIGIFSHTSVNANGSDILTYDQSTQTITSSSPAWQGVRHGFALCHVVGNALYFCGASEGYDASTPRWFDWFSVNLATGAAYSQANAALGANWLGSWTDSPQTVAFQNGMYRRRATNGEVWVNPRGNGAQTISFGRAVKLINSAQDPKQNGSTVTTLSMADRDGIAVLY